MTQAKNSVKVGTNYKWFFGIVVVAILICVAVMAFKPAGIPEGYLSPEEVQIKKAAAVAEALVPKDAEITDLVQQLLDLQAVVPKPILGYLIDNLFLEGLLPVDAFSDREIGTLFDGEVSFDGDDYDAEETFTLKGITLLANGHDFEGNVYATVPKGAIEYKFDFDSDLDTSLIKEDETLTFNLLGEEVEVSEWIGNKITFSKGIEYFLDEGQSITFEEKTIVLDMVLDEAVYVTVDGVGGKIYEDKTKTINGIEIKVKEALYTEKESKVSKATLIIGEEVEVTVIGGDEYEENSPWEYVITANSIGLVLVEDFTEIDLDGDEEFPAIGADEKLCLPNEYVCIQFNGMTEEETEEYNLELDEKSSVGYVRIDGNFISGINDFDRIYVDATTGVIRDRDLKEINGTIELGDTKSILEASPIRILIKDSDENKLVWIGLDLMKIQVDENGSDWNDITSEDEDYLTNYGIKIINPEDSVDDQEFNVFVPEKKLEGSLSIIG